MLNQAGPALPALRRFIHSMIEGGFTDPQRRGCLIANTIMELSPHEEEIAGTLRQVLKMAEDTFFRVLARAKQQGELKTDKGPRRVARFLTTMMQGTIVMIKAGTPAGRGKSDGREPHALDLRLNRYVLTYYRTFSFNTRIVREIAEVRWWAMTCHSVVLG